MRTFSIPRSWVMHFQQHLSGRPTTLAHTQRTQELGQASPTAPLREARMNDASTQSVHPEAGGHAFPRALLWEARMNDICAHSAHPGVESSISYSTLLGGQNERRMRIFSKPRGWVLLETGKPAPLLLAKACLDPAIIRRILEQVL